MSPVKWTLKYLLILRKTYNNIDIIVLLSLSKFEFIAFKNAYHKTTQANNPYWYYCYDNGVKMI